MRLPTFTNSRDKQSVTLTFTVFFSLIITVVFVRSYFTAHPIDVLTYAQSIGICMAWWVAGEIGDKATSR